VLVVKILIFYGIVLAIMVQLLIYLSITIITSHNLYKGGFIMSQKISYDDLHALVNEMSLGADDKTRTINSISDPTVRDLVSTGAELAIKNNVTAALLGTVGTTAAGGAIGTIGAASGSIASAGLSSLGGSAVSTGLSSLGVGTVSAFSGAATGAAAGSTVPIIGTLIGAAVGAGVGIFAGKKMQQKDDNEKEALKQEVMSKQNTIIRDLENELNELKEKYGETVEQNERYRYIIGILTTNSQLVHSFA
jgi:hypothetical protein